MLALDAAVVNVVDRDATCDSLSASESLDVQADIKARANATFERMSPGWKALYKRMQARDLGHGVK